MKIFTQSITTLSIALMSLSSVAQYDMQIISISLPNSGGSVPLNYIGPVEYTYTNIGVETFPANYEFIRTISRGTTPVVGPDIITRANPLAPGDTVTLEASGYYNFASPHGNLEMVCGSVIPVAVPDIDSSNNIICQNFQVDTNVSDDIEVKDVMLVTPSFANINNFDIDDDALTPAPITEFVFTFKNVSDLPYPARQWNFETSLNSATADVIVTVGANFPPGDSLIIPFDASTGYNMPIPKVKGTYNFCVELTDPNKNQTNDKSCVTFKINNTKLGITDLEGSGLNLMFTNTFIGLTNYSLANIESQIVDMNGKLVLNVKNANQPKIDITSLPAGVYVITCVDTKTGESISEKFSKI